MTTEEKIKNVLKETYDHTKDFSTTIGAIVNLVCEKYEDETGDSIRSALAHMNGLERIGSTLEDQVKIGPSFF